MMDIRWSYWYLLSILAVLGNTQTVSEKGQNYIKVRSFNFKLDHSTAIVII